MPVPPPSTAELRRSAIARARTMGFFGIASWLILVFGVIGIVDGTIDLTLGVLAVASLAVRLAIATEYVRCDRDGLSWRSIFISRHVPWEQVAAIETAVVRNERWRGRLAMSAASMVVVLPNGVQQQLTASIWCPIMRHAEFIAAARLISPVDWADIEDGTVSVIQPGRGKRVGRPIPRRRRGHGT